MEYRILGPVEVWDGGRPLAITRQKELLLFATLLLHANEALPLDRIVDELWPNEPPAKPVDAIQELVYQLRKKLEGDRPRGSVLERDGDCYRMIVAKGELDLDRFERLLRVAETAKRDGDLQLASSTLVEALSIWRGMPLANVPCESLGSTKAAAQRLDELRFTVQLERIEIDLELGDESAAVPELESLVAEHPLDERPRRLLMLALYRDGRQADALEVYSEMRATLDDELGIEPGRALKELQQAILRQDRELDLQLEADAGAARGTRPTGDRTIVVAALEPDALDPLLVLGEPLARSQLARELVLALVVDPGEHALATAGAHANQLRSELLERGTESRAAAFTSPTPADDLIRLAAREGVDLMLFPVEEALREKGLFPPVTRGVLTGAPCDVALLGGSAAGGDGAILVPFGGQLHDWAALELAGWKASATGRPLRLLGTRAGADPGGRDASRLLADASLLLQAFLGLSPELQLVDPGPDEILAATEGAALLVVGLAEAWRRDGLGSTRLELLRRAACPVALVRKGTRPGGLAPRDSTVFAWSLTNLGSSPVGASLAADAEPLS